MKRNSNNDNARGVGFRLPPLPADAQYRSQNYDFTCPVIVPILGSNKSNESPANVVGAEANEAWGKNDVRLRLPHSEVYDPATWQIFHDL